VFLAAGVGVFFPCACQKNSAPLADASKPGADPATPALVQESERSRHFAAVNRQLELGGTLYGYVDVDGDVAKLATGAKELLLQMSKSQPNLAPFAQKDFAAIATTLGLTDIKAIGASSVAEADGMFRNRMFFYTGGERHGLLAGLGGKSGPFTHVKLAPADAALYAEAEIDLPVVYTAVKQVIAQMAGEPAGAQFETAIKKSGDRAALSVLDLIYGLKGHSSLVLRVDPDKPMRFPGKVPVVTPGLELLLTVDGIAPIVERALAQTPLKRSEQDGLHVYDLPGALPIPTLKPVLVADGNTLYVASTLAFLQQCRARQAGLAQNPEYRSALAAVGGEGNGIVYVHPRLFTALRGVEALNPGLPAESKSVLAMLAAKLPSTSHAMVAVRSNLPDGVLVRSSWDRSLKQEIAMGIAYNPVAVGLLAAMAIPAFQKVRMASQEKAIVNNLRMLSAAADQYYLENGTRTATYDQIVGPQRYVTVLNPVVGENYRTLRFVQGQPLRLQLPDGRAIQFPPGTVTPAPGANRR
jgi:type IV pilus assembly protein PilA